MSSDIINQIEDLDSMIEEIELNLLKASDVDWEQQQKAEQSIEKMEEIFNDIL